VKRVDRRAVLGVCGALALALAGCAAYAAWPRGSSPITEAEAIEAFRARSGEGTASGGTAADAAVAPSLPAPGVYRYTAVGEEEVKLGVLPAETRVYPETVTVTVVDAGDGCFTASLNLLEQHTEETIYCTGPAGEIRIAGHRKHQQVGAMSPTATMDCDPAAILREGEGVLPMACTLALAAGPANLKAEVAGSATSRGAKTVRVDGQEVEGVEVEIAYRLSGDITGAWTERLTFARESLVLLSIERELSMNGLAAFTEHSELVLASLEPKR